MMMHGFAKEIPVAGGTVSLRPMQAEDAAKVQEFASGLPTHDLLFLPRDITQPKVIQAWIRAIESGVLETLLAWQDERIVGCGAVYRDRHSWSPHAAELRVVTTPAVRGKGVGRALIQNCFQLMLQAGIEKILAQMTIDQQGAMGVFESLGFRSEGLLRDQVQDRDGKRHDIVILSHDVGRVLGRMAASGRAAQG